MANIFNFFMFKIPSYREVLIYAFISVLLTALFTFIYGYTNELAVLNPVRFRFYFDWELLIPLVPGMILVYLSLNLLTFLPLFVLESRDLWRLGLGFAYCTVVAGIIFYFFPAPVAYVRPNELGIWTWIYKMLYSLDREFNSLPSLHIAYSGLTVRVMNLRLRKPAAQKMIRLWFVLICASVVLTHQHHLADIFAGIILAELSFRFAFKATI